MMRALVLLCINQHTKIEMPRFTNSKDIIIAKFKKWVMWHWPRSIRGGLSSFGWDMT